MGISTRSRRQSLCALGAVVLVAAGLCACGDVVGMPIGLALDASTESAPKKDAGIAALVDASGDRTRSDRRDAGFPFFGRGPGPSLGASGTGTGSTQSSSHYCSVTAGWDQMQIDSEQSAIDAINDARASGIACGGQVYRNLPALHPMQALTCSARVHSMDMYSRGYFGETDSTGATPPMRMAAAGMVSFGPWGELIARRTDASHLVGDLMQSPSTMPTGPSACSDLTSTRFTMIGVGHYGELWTVDLAGP